MTDKICKINQSNPQPDIINKAAEIIKNSGIIVFPTWCLYGLAADAFSPEAVKKIFKIKNRMADNPLLILVKNKQQVEELVKKIPESAEVLMKHFWPGRITLVFEAEDMIPDILTAGTGKIGIRLPEHPVVQALLKQLQNPITGTSANISNAEGCSDIDEMDFSIIENTELTLDAGILKGGNGSTIVDVTTTPVTIIREGEISSEEIYRILNKSLS